MQKGQSLKPRTRRTRSGDVQLTDEQIAAIPLRHFRAIPKRPMREVSSWDNGSCFWDFNETHRRVRKALWSANVLCVWYRTKLVISSPVAVPMRLPTIPLPIFEECLFFYLGLARVSGVFILRNDIHAEGARGVTLVFIHRPDRSTTFVATSSKEVDRLPNYLRDAAWRVLGLLPRLNGSEEIGARRTTTSTGVTIARLEEIPEVRRGTPIGKRSGEATKRRGGRHESHKSPIPHPRRGHSRKVRVGSGDDSQVEERWIEATYVNASGPEDIPVTIRPFQGDQSDPVENKTKGEAKPPKPLLMQSAENLSPIEGDLSPVMCTSRATLLGENDDEFEVFEGLVFVMPRTEDESDARFILDAS